MMIMLHRIGLIQYNYVTDKWTAVLHATAMHTCHYMVRV